MIKIPLTQNKFALIDDDFSHFLQWKWYFTHYGYAARTHWIGNKKSQCVWMHRAIIGSPIKFGYEIDHINGNRLDNRKENLRFVTRSENNHNQFIHRNGRMPGVVKDLRKKLNLVYWKAYFGCGENRICIGNYKTERLAEEAIENYVPTKTLKI